MTLGHAPRGRIDAAPGDALYGRRERKINHARTPAGNPQNAEPMLSNVTPMPMLSAQIHELISAWFAPAARAA